MELGLNSGRKPANQRGYAMARIQTIKTYTVKQALNWVLALDTIPVHVGNIPAGKTLRHFAIPDSEADFTPNIGVIYALVSGLSGSIRSRFEGTNNNYNSFMSRRTRWMLDVKDYQDWKDEIIKHKKVAERMSPEFIAAGAALLEPALKWLSYASWLRMLGLAGILDPQVIGALPRSMASVRDNLGRMLGEWQALPFNGYVRADEAPPKTEATAQAGYTYVSEEAFAALEKVPQMTGAELDALRVKERTHFIGVYVKGALAESYHHCVFVNCIFDDVAFMANMTGASFIACDFEGDCRIEKGVEAKGLKFQSCRTFNENPLRLALLNLEGITFYDCQHMTVNIARSYVKDSDVRKGWVNCGRLSADKGQLEGVPRVAPRTIGGVWMAGGLDYDMCGVSAADMSENNASILRASVHCAIPGWVSRVVTLEGNEMTGENAGMQLFDNAGLSTREIAQYPWALSETAGDLMEEVSRRREAVGREKFTDAQDDESGYPQGQSENALMLERMILDEVNEASE